MSKLDPAKVFTRRITVRQMESVIGFGYRHRQAVFFFGGAGVGKSEKIAQLADEMFPEFLNNNLVDVRLSDKEPSDLAGIPIPVEIMVEGVLVTRTVFATPSFWPTNPDWKGIVLLDELTNAGPACQQATYQIMLDHKIGDFVFPKGAVFVGAGNRPGDNGATTELLGPLVNRMTVVEVDYNAQVWIEDFASLNDVHPNVIGFVKQNPEAIYTGHLVGEDDFEGPSFSSPRQLVKCGHILDDYDAGLLGEKKFDKFGNEDTTTGGREMAEILVQGTVGSSLVTAMMDYHVRTKKLPPVEDVLSGKKLKHDKPLDRTEVDLIYVLVSLCMRQLTKDVMNVTITDDQFVERTANFIKFMFDNHGEAHKDTMTALIINMMRKQDKVTPLLDMNPKRVDIQIKLAEKSTELMQVVSQYTKRYAHMAQKFR